MARTADLDYVNPASTGNASDFGNLLSAARYVSGGFSDNTRGEIWGGEYRTNAIQYITIASAGDATDAGNMTISAKARSVSGASG
mgnify:FL=1